MSIYSKKQAFKRARYPISPKNEANEPLRFRHTELRPTSARQLQMYIILRSPIRLWFALAAAKYMRTGSKTPSPTLSYNSFFYDKNAVVCPRV